MRLTACENVLKEYLFSKDLPYTLRAEDRISMANSIEIRVPFLDNNLTDYAMGLPSNYKIRFGNKKWILKQALKNELPASILNGKKTGFSVPVDYWLKKPLLNYMVSYSITVPRVLLVSVVS